MERRRRLELRGLVEFAGRVCAIFDLDITEVVLTHLNESATRLVIESWHPDRGYEIRDWA